MINSIANMLSAVRREPDLKNLSQTLAGNLHTIGIVTIQQHHSVLRHDSKQPLETQLYFIEISKNIGMIEFDVVYDHQFGQIMHKLRPLIEESGIVFIAFEDDI